MILSTLFLLIIGSIFLLIYRHIALRTIKSESRAIERIAAFVTNRGGDLSLLDKGISHQNFVECIVYLSERLNGAEQQMIAIIMRYYHIESYLLQSASRSKNCYQRAYFLALLARLPLSERTATRLIPFISDKFSRVRFYALLSIIATDPQLTIRAIERVEGRLSHNDVAELLSVLERGVCIIPCIPLLTSDNYNMQLFGLALVRRYGITEGRTYIVRIIEQEHNPLREQALEALTSLGFTEQYNNHDSSIV